MFLLFLEIRDIVYCMLLLRPRSNFSYLPDELFFDILSRAIPHDFTLDELLSLNCHRLGYRNIDYDRILHVYLEYPRYFYESNFEISFLES